MKQPQTIEHLFNAKGKQASHLRRRKYELVRQFGLPETALSGLSVSRRRCGKSHCHCAGNGALHRQGAVCVERDGVKTKVAVPAAWLGALEEAVLEWRSVQDALDELVSINVALLDLKRKEHSLKKKRTSANAQNKKA